jgi:hypothetical protein
MTYATGSASTIANVMDAMSLFAQANAGMTETKRRAENIINRVGASELMTVICLTKGLSNWWFAYGATDCQGFLADSNGGTVWHTTGGVQAGISRVWPISPPFTSYHLFTEGSVVHIAFEMSSGAWAHINFGDITKYGTWTGGSFFGFTNADGFLGTQVPGSGNNVNGFNAIFGELQGNATGDGASSFTTWIRMTKGARSYGHCSPLLNLDDGATTPVIALGLTVGVADQLTRDQPNIFNNRAMGPRLELFASDTNVIFTGGTNLWLPIGYVPNIRFISIALLNPKDLINTNWMTFPLQSKTGLNGSFAQTFSYGIAVSK